MEGSNVQKAQGPKEALLEFLETNSPIYTDAAIWTLLYRFGISLTSLFPNLDSRGDRETFLKELQKDGSYIVVNDPKGGSEVLVKLTKKGRDENIDSSYSGKKKTELKRILKRMDDLHPKEE